MLEDLWLATRDTNSGFACWIERRKRRGLSDLAHIKFTQSVGKGDEFVSNGEAVDEMERSVSLGGDGGCADCKDRSCSLNNFCCIWRD